MKILNNKFIISKHLGNFSGLVLNQFASFLTPIIILLYVGRYYPHNDFGIYSVAVSFANIFAVFFSFGLGNIIIYEIAYLNIYNKERIPYFIGDAIVSFFILSLFCFSMIPIALNFFNYDIYLMKIILILLIGNWFLCFSNLFISIFIGQKKMFMPVLFSGTTLLGVIGFVFPALFLKKDILTIVLLLTVSRTLGMVVIIFAVLKMKLVHFSFKVKFNSIRYIIKRSLGVGLDNVIYMMGVNITNILLPIFIPLSAVGIFNGVFRPFTVLTLPHQILFTFSSPYFSEKKDVKYEREMRLQIFHEVVSLINIFIMTFVFFFPEKLTVLFFGEKFISVPSYYMKFLSLGYLIYYFPPYSAIIKAFGFEWQVLSCSFIQLLVNIVCLVILVPRYGLKGAVLSIIIAYLSYWLAEVYIYWRNKIQPVRRWDNILKYLFITLLTGYLLETYITEYAMYIFAVVCGSIIFLFMPKEILKYKLVLK